jgi:hypothetical protein
MNMRDRSARLGRFERTVRDLLRGDRKVGRGDCSGRVRFPVIAQVMMTFCVGGWVVI